MAGKTLQIKIPAWTANLLPNLFGLAGLAGICVFVAYLTDWRWGGLLGSVFALGLAVWIQSTAAAPAAEARVTPLKKAS